MESIKKDIVAPNHDYLELNYVGETATGRGNNTQFIMENLGNGMFQITDGRVGIKIGRFKPKVYTRLMSEWDSIYESKIEHGYLLTKTHKMETKKIVKQGMSVDGNHYKPLSDTEVAEIVSRLLSFANQVMAENFTVKLDDISDEMIVYGRKVLDELAAGYDNMSVAEFNNKLKVLYAAIPRRIDNLSKILPKRKAELNDIVANEQELFDIMINQLRNNEMEKTSEKTILDAFQLEWTSVTTEEEDYIKKKLGSEARNYIKAWKVCNKKTEQAFEQYCKAEGLTETSGISHLFHGSRNENFWSICTNGLTINPSGVVITGKMFGNGTYFAPKAEKSIGYTSRYGSRWANGSSQSGFLAIYKVATGKEYRIENAESDLTWKKLQDRCPGAHCTWAYAGKSLYNDEVIVYQDCQSTIEYLVEIQS